MEEGVKIEYLTAPKSTHTFVYVSTIQRMARNLFGAEGCFAQSGGDNEAEADADKLEIPILAFDIIIADVRQLGAVCKRRALEERDTLCVGRTHGIHAEPMTMGMKFGRWAFAWKRAETRLHDAREAIAVGACCAVWGETLRWTTASA